MHIFTEFTDNAHARDGREEGVKVLQFFSARFRAAATAPRVSMMSIPA